MKVANIILASAATVTIIGSAALAQQKLTGTITELDRLNGTIAIQPTQNGTVGAATGAGAEKFKTQDGALLGSLHAGDKVVLTVIEKDGVKMITEAQKQ
jgi:hypothetical protein